MSNINEKMSISEILLEFPETLNVFTANGFETETIEKLIGTAGEALILQTALKAKHLNVGLFVKMLDDCIYESQNSNIDLAERNTFDKKIDFLGITYCPLKMTFSDCFQETITKYKNETGKDINYFVPSGCGDMDEADNVYRAENIDELPGVIVDAGFKEFFSKNFVSKFINKGYFKSIKQERMNKAFSGIDLEDPDDEYTIYSIFPLVMLVDRDKLGGLPLPEKWSDLLNPIYKKNIITAVSPDNIAEEILLSIYKEFGEEGIKKFAGNIKNIWHASKMSKTAGSGNKNGAAIYIIPWFFAQSCPNTEKTQTVWPSDGALITPLLMLVKKSEVRELKFVTDFVNGSYFGQKSADNFFPVLNPDVDNKLPEGSTFKWLGWDYIKANNLEELSELVVDIFNKYWNYEGCRKEKAI